MADKNMKKAFTLVEVLIVVSILGILAAIVVPQFQTHSAKAKESAAKDNLRILRTTIGIYAARNSGLAPGYPGNDPTETPNYGSFLFQLKVGKYLNKVPFNGINDLQTIKFIGTGDFPVDPTGDSGWVYQPSTKTIKLNSLGTDSEGIRYFDY